MLHAKSLQSCHTFELRVAEFITPELGKGGICRFHSVVCVCVCVRARVCVCVCEWMNGLVQNLEDDYTVLSTL